MADDHDRTLDETLIRRFEPIIHFTRGEKFFPADAEAYLRECSLWEQTPRNLPVCLVKKGELTPEHLGGPYATRQPAIHYLKFVEPLSVTRLAQHQLQQALKRNDPDDGTFYAGFGRLARVGYLARVLDALFSLVLLMRGRVPGSAGAAAAQKYEQMYADGRRCRYYGRVVRQDQWVVLQYWFFYYFNSWRSGFHGANDHEADWEMASIYLSEQQVLESPDTVVPEWVAYASHDHIGDDLRRHWNDPELKREGDHPLIFAGAGSHASYFSSGEYLTELTLAFLAPVLRVAETGREFWSKRFRTGVKVDDQPNDSWGEILRIPFIDYARGDGFRLGPGQPLEWDPPVLVSDPPKWMSNYRGLWGLFTGDPFDGEDAPGGAMFNRDGSIRRSWYDPVGWCGLDLLAPADRMLEMIQTRREILTAKIAAAREQIEEMREEIAGQFVEHASVGMQPDLVPLFESSGRRLDGLRERLAAMRAELARDESVLGSLGEYAERLRSGYQLPLRNHLRRPARPASRAELRTNRFADFWAAASIGLMLIGVVALILFARQYLVSALITVAFLVALIESWFKRRFTRFITNAAFLLSAIAVIILLYHFLWPALTLLVLTIGVYILWENLKELWT
jgi:hypothetical protein